MMRIRKGEGYTLIELMITLTIAAIMTILAIPGFRTLIQNNRAINITNDIAASLNYSRSEAVGRGNGVAVCASVDTAQSACGGNNWNNGWLVFNDTDGDGIQDAGEATLRVHGILSNDATVTPPAGVIAYDSSGFVTQGSGNFTITVSGCTANNARLLSVSNTGRVSISSIGC